MCTACTPPLCVDAVSSGLACSGSARVSGASVPQESTPGSGMSTHTVNVSAGLGHGNLTLQC